MPTLSQYPRGRRRRVISAIRRLNDYGVAVDIAEFSCAERRTDCSRLLDPAAIDKTAVALDVAEELISAYKESEGKLCQTVKLVRRRGLEVATAIRGRTCLDSFRQ